MTIGNAKWVFADEKLLADEAGIEALIKAVADYEATEILKKRPAHPVAEPPFVFPKRFDVIDTVAGGAGGVVLPAAKEGEHCIVRNSGADPLLVYPRNTGEGPDPEPEPS